MKIDFKPYVLLYTDEVDIYDVHFIIIDEKDQTIDVCDSNGFSIANIHYQDSNEIGYLEYDENERLNGNGEILVKKGKLTVECKEVQ